MGELRDPYNRIMQAAKVGRGVRLTAQEAFEMSLDDAIMTRAAVLEFGDEDEIPSALATSIVEDNPHG